MNEAATLIIAIIGAVIVWTTSVVAMVSWLTGKFRHVEVQIYREGDKLKRIVNRHSVRLQRLEADTFGVTHSGEFEDGAEP